MPNSISDLDGPLYRLTLIPAEGLDGGYLEQINSFSDHFDYKIQFLWSVVSLVTLEMRFKIHQESPNGNYHKNIKNKYIYRYI